VEERAERTVDELRGQAEQFARGEIGVGEFVADLDWALPGIGQRGGRYAWQSTGLIGDALDASTANGLDAREALVLVKAAEIASREGDDPDSVNRVHQVLASAGLAAGEPPQPRARGVTRSVGMSAAAPSPSEHTPVEVDPALDPEIARMAGKAAPPRSALAPLRLMGLGWVVVLSLVVGVVAGIWLDGRFGTSPILTVVGLVLGLIGAYLSGRNLVRESREA
jgi:ATP synthase protein I